MLKLEYYHIKTHEGKGTIVSKNYKEIIKQKIEYFKRELKAIYLAYKSPDMPLHAKILAAIVIAYALSPIDLIPDFIPILGYLDDFILIPLGVTLVVKLVPLELMEKCRLEADAQKDKDNPRSIIGGVVITAIWVLIIAFILYRFLK